MTPLAGFASYADAVARFRWDVPARFNIAAACCDRWAAADPDRIALVLPEGDDLATVSFLALRRLADRFANVFAARGVRRGDRVAIMLGQRLETVAAHLATYKLGAVAVPLAAVFGPDAMAYRLAASGAAVLVTTAAAAERAPDDVAVFTVDAPADRAEWLAPLVERAADRFATVDTGADESALMIFTSGTTGQPKGALHGHRVLLGHMPGVAMMQDLMPLAGDRFWTPADWAWAGGLLNVLLPSLAMGVPVVAQRADRFDPDEALDWIARAGVRNAFIPATALRMMRDTRPTVRLRSAGSAGEQLGATTFEWARSTLGLTVNEAYGQTEVNLVLASCAAWGIAAPGAIGRPVPGHEVAILGPAGEPVPDGTEGTIAIAAPAPVMFLGYYGAPEATAEKYRGRWLTTGDRAIATGDGVVFLGRDDDVINSSGYRIGPGEIEDSLALHPAVSLAAVVGRPDPIRGEVVAAFVRLVDGILPSDTLKADIQAFVRDRLSAHEYPRIVEFVPDVPLTSTGKVMRRLFRDA